MSDTNPTPATTEAPAAASDPIAAGDGNELANGPIQPEATDATLAPVEDDSTKPVIEPETDAFPPPEVQEENVMERVIGKWEGRVAARRRARHEREEQRADANKGTN